VRTELKTEDVFKKKHATDELFSELQSIRKGKIEFTALFKILFSIYNYFLIIIIFLVLRFFQ
jgi:hypothetical protein